MHFVQTAPNYCEFLWNVNYKARSNEVHLLSRLYDYSRKKIFTQSDGDVLDDLSFSRDFNLFAYVKDET